MRSGCPKSTGSWWRLSSRAARACRARLTTGSPSRNGSRTKSSMERNGQPRGGFGALIEDAARGLDVRLGAPVVRLVLERSRRHGDLQRRHASEGRPRGDRRSRGRAARRRMPTLDPRRRPSSRRRSAELAMARLLGKVYLRFPHRFWPETPQMVRPSSRLTPDKRGTFNTWVSLERETGLPILLSFANGETALHLDREVDDAEREESALEVAAVDVRQRRARARWIALSTLAERSVVARRLFLSRASAVRRKTATPMRGRSAAGCSSPERPRSGRIRHRACRTLVRRTRRRGYLPRCYRRRAVARRAAVGASSRPMRDRRCGIRCPCLANILFVLRDPVGSGDARHAVRRPDQHGRGIPPSPSRAAGGATSSCGGACACSS